MSVLVRAKGITKLSQLQIDVDKDWQGKGMTNVKHIAEGMAKAISFSIMGRFWRLCPPRRLIMS